MRFLFVGFFFVNQVSGFYNHCSSKSNSLRLFSESARVSIEFCTGCRWMLRSTWMAQELLVTTDPGIKSLTLIPSRIKPGGVFTVRGNDQVILWDRKEQGGFPDSLELQQRVQGMIEKSAQPDMTIFDCKDCPTPMISAESTIVVREPHVTITYCTESQYLLRSAWFAQELFTTFDSELNAVTLIPYQPKVGVSPGTFLVQLDGELLWDKEEEGRFPDTKKLKQMIRDKISPERNLGHSESKTEDILVLNDDDAVEMRKFFGVQ